MEGQAGRIRQAKHCRLVDREVIEVLVVGEEVGRARSGGVESVGEFVAGGPKGGDEDVCGADYGPEEGGAGDGRRGGLDDADVVGLMPAAAARWRGGPG